MNDRLATSVVRITEPTSRCEVSRSDMPSSFDRPNARCWAGRRRSTRSEEHTSELQSLMRISYAVFCLKQKNNKTGQSEYQTFPHIQSHPAKRSTILSHASKQH